MKYLVLFLLVALSGPAVASQQDLPSAPAQVSREEISNYCLAMSLIGEAAAVHFQTGGEMKTLMDHFNDDPTHSMSSELRQSVAGIAADAQRLPKHPLGAEREKVIRAFRDELRQGCMQTLYR